MSILKVEVNCAAPYRVLIGPGALASLPGLIRAPRVALITDENLAALYGPQLRSLFAAGPELLLHSVPAGESSKNAATFVALLEALAAESLGRDTAIIGFGGGVVTDLAGFVAASYLRGLPYYSVPTSLLGMIDAGVGGKTGINLSAGKNLAGAFWQPQAVLLDTDLLASLPEREFRFGAVELFKHGLIGNPDLLDLLDDPEFAPGGPGPKLAAWLAAGVQVKADVVGQDELEQGVRIWLNYGHTLAHALETATDHALAHGEAVAYGILFAALLGRERGLADVTGFAQRLLTWVDPQPLPPIQFTALLPFLQRDKKNTVATSRFVLLEKPGQPIVASDISQAAQEHAWLELLQLQSGASA